MIKGHGDDTYQFDHIVANFSSNVYEAVPHPGLIEYLTAREQVLYSYPEPQPYRLALQIARLNGMDPSQVMVCNGATEGIYLIAQAFYEQTSAVLMPTFSEYADACRIYRHRVRRFYTLQSVPPDARIVWLCNPNNPTGEVHDKEQLSAVIRTRPDTLFVIDQSYEAYTRKPLFGMSEALAFGNVILLHSMTKRFAVPGLRLGFLTAPASLIEVLQRLRMPWSVNALAIEAGHYLLTHAALFAFSLDALLAETQRLIDAIGTLGLFDVWPTDTHYMLVRLRMGHASALKYYLAAQHGLLIRDASNFEGLDAHYVRIATQRKSHNDLLIKGLKAWKDSFAS